VFQIHFHFSFSFAFSFSLSLEKNRSEVKISVETLIFKWVRSSIPRNTSTIPMSTGTLFFLRKWPNSFPRIVFFLSDVSDFVNEWRAIGVQQSRGWVHYAIHRPEPHIMLFRRTLNYQQQQENQA
ncbi:hypothetical protein G4B88_015690, partial [Cannabis sativa]